MNEDTSLSVGLQSVWFLMFVLIKVAGTTLADWSWWWLLLPIVPDLAFIFAKLGWSL